jgi:hypothetical protein
MAGVARVLDLTGVVGHLAVVLVMANRVRTPALNGGLVAVGRGDRVSDIHDVLLRCYDTIPLRGMLNNPLQQPIPESAFQVNPSPP